jgi:GT2 family glycosyltransferase
VKEAVWAIGSQAALTELPAWRAGEAGCDALEDCSLVIPTYERPHEVVSLLSTLMEMRDTPFEVLIIDGSVTAAVEEGIRHWLRDCAPPFRLVYVKSPTGLTIQRNIGIDASTGKIVFYLDDDCIPWHGYFRQVRDTFRRGGGSIGAVGGLVMNEVGKPIPKRWRLRRLLRIVPDLPPMKYGSSGTSLPRGLLSPFSEVKEADVLPGCCFTFSRDVLATERFSEYFTGYSQGEDLEMALRVSQKWRVVCCGSARATHNAASSGRPSSYRKGYMEVCNRWFIWKRHRADHARVDAVRFWLDVALLVIMDAAWIIRLSHPASFFQHALGVLAGAITCAVKPFTYEEPPPSRRYGVVFQACKRLLTYQT